MRLRAAAEVAADTAAASAAATPEGSVAARIWAADSAARISVDSQAAYTWAGLAEPASVALPMSAVLPALWLAVLPVSTSRPHLAALPTKEISVTAAVSGRASMTTITGAPTATRIIRRTAIAIRLR